MVRLDGIDVSGRPTGEGRGEPPNSKRAKGFLDPEVEQVRVDVSPGQRPLARVTNTCGNAENTGIDLDKIPGDARWRALAEPQQGFTLQNAVKLDLEGANRLAETEPDVCWLPVGVRSHRLLGEFCFPVAPDILC